MKKKEDAVEKRVRAIAVCGCLCLVALGTGVTYRAYDRSHMETAEQEQPVTAMQSPTIEVAALDRDKRSNDPGEEPEKEIPAKQQEKKQMFTHPLKGEIILPYSVDHAVYDPTLEQYRTNASVSISAEQGAEVKAAAEGTVEQVTADEESGNIIVISHENGWLTTYGQLETAVKVKEGDKVKQGQAIGSVGRPTKYGVALGNHLEFAMEQNGQPKDPSKYLK